MEPQFSIIIPHFDGVISDADFLRCIDCFKNQTFKDFEILLYHDGPLSRPLPSFDLNNVSIIVTEKRYNDWGHTLRDFGIRQAKGKYILHFNPDNILYADALEKIQKKSLEHIPYQQSNDIIIFPVIMKGLQTNGKFLWREKENSETKELIFTGNPPILNNIDCMQLVMKRSTWLLEGGWFDKTETSDGKMYQMFVHKYGARYCSQILGEHR